MLLNLGSANLVTLFQTGENSAKRRYRNEVLTLSEGWSIRPTKKIKFTRIGREWISKEAHNGRFIKLCMVG